MNIVDSSCWIEYFHKTPIGDAVLPAVERPRELLVPSIVLYEVCKYLLSNTSEKNVISFIQMMHKGQIIVLDSGLSISAANFSRNYKLAMADSIIYATAERYNAVLWTADEHFSNLPNVQYFDKTQSEPDA
jgi:predicted nucleic acid-binding protein